ncbi:MAG: hypothetical protein JOZ07_01935 [Solirubrobacterales bacterium]|nr:hypothetical protein [Solirubrobacterales bacterium]
MRFLRTASTRRLLTVIVGAIVVIAAGGAIAIAAAGSGPVAQPASLADAAHRAAAAPAPAGITAEISFTNNLIDSSDFTGQATDPILQGATGRLWLTGNHLRLELQSDDGDAQVLVDGRSFWVSDPTSHTVYEGMLPADSTQHAGAGHQVPSVAQIQALLAMLAQRMNISGAQPTDVAGQPAYRVSVSPRHDGGLLGQLQLAWDADRGVPLEFGIYARNNTTPVLDLKATDISYGAVAESVFAISPPSGDQVVQLATAGHATPGHATPGHSARMPRGRHAQLSGVGPVAAAVPFKLNAKPSLVGLPRRGVRVLDMGDRKAALITYGQGLGGLAIIEQAAAASSRPSGGTVDGLNLPTVSINGATGQELSTALGTVLRFTSGKVAYTLIQSGPAQAAEAAARALTGS